MARVHDVAEYILQQLGPMSTWKLQKLVYYAQAWHLVWDEQPLFEDRIEAWANGPVTPALYQIHRGRFSTESLGGDASGLSRGERETVTAVLDHYGSHTPQYLSDLTHLERPWRDARRGVPNRERSSVEITQEAIAEYYGSL